MEKAQFLGLLESEDFSTLFNELGWNRPASARPISYQIGSNNKQFVFEEAAELSVRVFVCKTDYLPSTTERNILDTRLRKTSNSYIAIFSTNNEPMHHLWMVPVHSVDKRSLVRIEYQERNQADFLFGKIQELQFPIGSTPNTLEVIEKINKVFQVNSTDVTKRFYREFKLKHNSFVRGIQGVTDDKDIEWYASVMLNRLMFCYFIQKKGFLDFNVNYLPDKLREVQDKKGRNEFYGSFYKNFLRILFSDGLNKRRHSKKFENEFGRIPYLNGGMFEVHKLEEKYPELDIPDSVFEELFNFFDQWRWHLDTSITASGKDINPDVLGYIFEQYINDRAQMGAYYTKEDITEYIGRNTIVPWLINKTAENLPPDFEPNGYVWKSLKDSGDSYIFQSVKKGVNLQLPPEIEIGVDTSKPELRKRRSEWNKPASDEYALPTEIWRETIARRQRYQEIRDKIVSGDIKNINDFITYNLNIRQFTEDLLSKTCNYLFIKHFYQALTKVTILDPTCGSGAFLFAALNILEPFYEICLTRMQEEWPDKFEKEIEELKTKYHGNLKYCIYKNIILRNLYGVDIMHEAVEIAKLRLFLKMVAVVDVDEMADNLGLDPLPDIDFNIRCGNTLVGFVNPQDVKDAILPPDELGLNPEIYKMVEEKASDISMLYEKFKSLQQTEEGSLDFFEAKKRLNEKLYLLNDELDRALAKRFYNIEPDSRRDALKFSEWKIKTQPFHWYSEFYGIVVSNGGFDVLIGNPPYVEYKKVKDYKIYNYQTESCGNLYAFLIERSEMLINEKSHSGMIVPHSAICTDRMEPLFNIFISKKGWFSTYDIRPSKLFDGVDQRLLIYILGGENIYSSKYNRWNEENRATLFENINYYEATVPNFVSLSKFDSKIEKSIYNKVTSFPSFQSLDLSGANLLYYHNAPRYFIRFSDTPPYFYSDRQGEVISVHVKTLRVGRKLNLVAAALNSSLFYWWFIGFSNCRDLVLREIIFFHIPDIDIPTNVISKLFLDFKRNSKRKETYYRETGRVVYDEFYPKMSKPIIDEIDNLLAKHYGFNEEELDFIINYDIKYRMGDRLGEED